MNFKNLKILKILEKSKNFGNLRKIYNLTKSQNKNKNKKKKKIQRCRSASSLSSRLKITFTTSFVLCRIKTRQKKGGFHSKNYRQVSCFFINVAVNKSLSVFCDLSRLMPHAFAGFQRTKTRRRIE